MLLSLALPGLGHWYLRRRALAVVEMALGLALLAAAMTTLVMAIYRSADAMQALTDTMRAAIGEIIRWSPALIGYPLLDGLFTWTVSRRRVVMNAEKSRVA